MKERSSPLILGAITSNVRTAEVLQQQHGGVRAAQQRYIKAAKPLVINRINKGLLAT